VSSRDFHDIIETAGPDSGYAINIRKTDIMKGITGLTPLGYAVVTFTPSESDAALSKIIPVYGIPSYTSQELDLFSLEEYKKGATAIGETLSKGGIEVEVLRAGFIYDYSGIIAKNAGFGEGKSKPIPSIRVDIRVRNVNGEEPAVFSPENVLLTDENGRRYENDITDSQLGGGPVYMEPAESL